VIADRRPIRVLLVEDSSADVLLFRSALADQDPWSFEVGVCGGDEAIDVLRTTDPRPDVVVVGEMPDASMALNRFRHLWSAADGCPLVLSLEFFHEDATEAMAAAGVQAIVPKSLWVSSLLPNTLALVAASSERRRIESRDLLTGLLMRGAWTDRVDHAIERCRRSHQPFAVLLVDVDDFKRVNDTMGHDSGDRYLREIATRLRSGLREQDTVARLGGDEFGLLLEDLAYPEAALKIAANLIDKVCEPIAIGRSMIPVSISIGIAILSADHRRLTYDWAHKAADTALYDAKRQGKNRYSLFTADMDRELLAEIQLDDDIAKAAKRDEFELQYQPIIDLRTGQLEGFEALLRWESGPSKISPSTFVPALERMGMMDRVGRVVFSQAIEQLARWRRLNGHDLSMHVNLSASQIIDTRLTDMVLDRLQEFDVPPHLLVIEFTESILVRHSMAIEHAFSRLRKAGVRLAIDDFGTGYNSFVNLKLLQPDVIKIDRGFIDGLQHSSVDAAIVRSQAVLAASLGITLVAEGVENERQLLALQHAGEVSMAQGFLLGRPMTAQAIETDFRPFRVLSNVSNRRRFPQVHRAAYGGHSRLRTSCELADLRAS
jgi:diguanylate cyclase